MISDIQNAVRNSSGYLIRDAAGAAAIMVMLVVALHSPSFF